LKETLRKRDLKLIKIENISYTFKNGTQALKDISFDIPQNRITSIMGESGSGKTTLLRCLGQFIKPQQGTILYNHKNINNIEEKVYRSKLGIVFQNLNLFPHLTVEKNISLALNKVKNTTTDEAKQQTEHLLEKLNISDLIAAYPSQISGGQAQRVAIARALALKPEYLLLDEPTSALDPATTKDFGNWLIQLRDDTSFIIVTHDEVFAKQVADNIIELSHGMIATQ